MSRPQVSMDLECYPDFFLCKFYDPARRKFHSVPMYEGVALDIDRIALVLARCTVITFNGSGYDIPMIVLAMHGATCEQMKEANDDIIVRGLKPWEFYRKWGIEQPDWIDFIDIMEVAPGVRISLKMYMGRMHAPTLQDLPYDPSTALDGIGRFVIDGYCGNDLIGTDLLLNELKDRIALRVAIGERYGIDVRSKSDAQIAEAVIKAQLDFKPQHRYIQDNYQFHYTPPDYIAFVTPQMQDFLDVVRTAPFVVRDKEEAIAFGYYDPEDDSGPKIRTGVRIPKELDGRNIIIGNTTYRLGIGGLHSQEKSTSYHSIPGVQTLKDIDVKSYYPSLILGMNMVPEQLGSAFLIIYRAIYERRLLSKAEASRLTKLADCFDGEERAEMLRLAHDMQTESDGLKIVLNGTFGKLFSKWSVLFAPELGIRVTITGQLALLMLIEMMESSGIRVVSANTDGIVLLIPHGMDHMVGNVVKWWEQRTGLEMEETLYRSVYSRDVNNYLAITTDGKVKRKGVFNQGGVLSGPQGKGPNMDVCADAVIALLKDGVPIADTIIACRDIRKFIVLRGVTGGGYFMPKGMDSDERVYLGKAARWYYSNANRNSCIVNKHGHKTATSDGAMECMKLPAELPTDIDYGRYVRNAMEMVASLGLPVTYWYHPESECVFIDHAGVDHAAQGCDEITKAKYKRMK